MDEVMASVSGRRETGQGKEGSTLLARAPPTTAGFHEGMGFLHGDARLLRALGPRLKL